MTGTARQIAGGLLMLRCTASGYLYTAERRGTTMFTASVRPRCRPDTMCAEWMTQPKLTITIY